MKRIKIPLAVFKLGRPRRWLRSGVILGCALVGTMLAPLTVWAQAISPLLRDQFLSDPELTEPLDPLLPKLPIVRPLSPLEKRSLRQDLDRLAEDAERLFQEQETDLAFQTWMREVRLRRILGVREELQAMRRVGTRAWESSRTEEVQLLTLRLRQIEAKQLAQAPLDVPLLEEIAGIFEILRDVDAAIALYETLVVQAAQAGDRAERQRLLETLATLQETWFRFGAAGSTYGTLLRSLTTVTDPTQEVTYLRGAIRNYENADDRVTALGFQRRLVAVFQASNQPQAIPAVLLAIARNYRALGDLPQAQSNYSAAYSAALSQQQLAIASDALKDLAALYLAQDKTADVLYLHSQRLAVNRLAYDGYGLMSAFEDLGKLFAAQGDLDRAIAAYQEALLLATHLNHREVYFNHQLQLWLIAQGRLIVPIQGVHQSSPVQPLANPDAWQGNSGG